MYFLNEGTSCFSPVLLGEVFKGKQKGKLQFWLSEKYIVGFKGWSSPKFEGGFKEKGNSKFGCLKLGEPPTLCSFWLPFTTNEGVPSLKKKHTHWECIGFAQTGIGRMGDGEMGDWGSGPAWPANIEGSCRPEKKIKIKRLK